MYIYGFMCSLFVSPLDCKSHEEGNTAVCWVARIVPGREKMLSECFLNGLKNALISPGHVDDLLDVLVGWEWFENPVSLTCLSWFCLCERWVDGTGGPAGALWETFQTQNSCAFFGDSLRKPPRY